MSGEVAFDKVEQGSSVVSLSGFIGSKAAGEG